MSTQYDDPNREAVGMPPIWTGADAAPDEHKPRSKHKAPPEVEITEGK